MSPIFKRKKKQQSQANGTQNTAGDSQQAQAAPRAAQKLNATAAVASGGAADTAAAPQNAIATAAQENSAGAAGKATEARSESGAETAKIADLATRDAASTTADTKQETQQNQAELAASAYAAWHNALQTQVAANSTKNSSRYLGHIDITNAHPTGVAQFYAHTPTRLSSLIREPKAFARAKEQLAQLRELVTQISAEHGYAPISLAAGRITWTELPALETSEIPQWTGETYEATGELRLDFSQLPQLHEKNQPFAQNAPQTVPSEADTAVTAAAAQESQTTRDPEIAEDPVLSAPATPAPVASAPLETEIKTATERTLLALYRRIQIEFLPDGDAQLKLSAQAEINPEIIQALRLAGIEPERIAKLREVVQRSVGIDQPLEQLAAVARAYLPGFSFETQNLIGCFHRPAQVLLADLEAMEPYIRNSGIVAALAGAQKIRKITRTPVPPGLAADRLPEVERGAGDLDPAELDVVEAVAAGRSLIIDAPAGSNRIETLAAIMADAAASGKSLIFVPSRSSASDALKNALTQLGLGEMVLDFNDLENVPRQIRTGLRLKKPEIDFTTLLAQREELSNTRSRLENFIAQLHQIDPELDLSVHDLLQKLAKLTAGENAPRTRVRFSAETLAEIKKIGKTELLQTLYRGAQLGVFAPTHKNSAWENSPLTNPTAAAAAIMRALELQQTILPNVIAQVARAAGETGLHQAQTPQQWFEQLQMFAGISQSLDNFLPQIFETSPAQLIAVTATKEWRNQRGIKMNRSEKRLLRRELADLVRPGAVIADMHQELLRVHERRETWKRYTKDLGWPTLPSAMAQIQADAQELEQELTALAAEIGVESLLTTDFAQLAQLLEQLVADAPEMEQLPERNLVKTEIQQRGLENFVRDLQTRHINDFTEQRIAAEFELAFSSSVFEQLLRKSQLLAALGPRDLTALIEKFQQLDLMQVRSLSDPVQLAAINNMRSYARAHREETIRLDQLLAKHGVGVLRDVIATYPRLVQLARPIWIVPPLVAVEYIPQMHWVDLVLCDTTERTELAAIISILLRGRQLVLAGDRRRNEIVQPNEKNAAAGENAAAITKENVAAAKGGVKTDVPETRSQVLDLGTARAFDAFLQIFPVLELPTLRAEHDEIAVRALLAHGYSDAYFPIPACPQKNDAHLTVVDGRGVPSAIADGAVESPTAEVDAVVDLIVNYALDRTPDSLAVITVSQLHARQIRKALQNAKTSSVILERFMQQNTAEPFRVLDISQAAGLRRDHVIFSPGFGKTVHGRVLHSFGQLQEPQGFLDLVDTLEVPRKSMTVVSSLGVGEIDTSRVVTPGPKLLAQIIAEAANAADLQANFATETANFLLADLGKRLREQGFEIGYDYGYLGSRKIPLVVGLPTARGIAWEVAVLIDDDQYAATESLRRRDRFLPQMTAKAGWLVHQTFSTSLFIDPAGQAAEIAAKIRAVNTPVTPPELIVPILDDETWVEEPFQANAAGADLSRMAVGQEQRELGEQLNPVAGNVAQPRGVRPSFTPGLQLSAYTDDQLDEIVAWIVSDRLPRTAAELIEELRKELGIARKGAQIDAVLGNVVRRSGAVSAAGVSSGNEAKFG